MARGGARVWAGLNTVLALAVLIPTLGLRRFGPDVDGWGVPPAPEPGSDP